MLERTVRATGMDGVYMDMIGHAAHGCCYNPRHRHPKGGGRHMVDGYRAYVAKVRADNPGFYLSTEEQGEAYLDLFESFIFVHSSAERFGVRRLRLGRFRRIYRRWKTSVKFRKLHRSIPASGSSNTDSTAFLASTVAISIRFSSPPDRLAFTSRST